MCVAPQPLGRAGELAGIDGATLPVGRYADVTLTFSDAGEVEISVPVVARNASYADVADLATAHGGSIEVQSAPGQGATFSVRRGCGRRVRRSGRRSAALLPGRARVVPIVVPCNT